MLAASDVLAAADALPFACDAVASAEDVSVASVKSFIGFISVAYSVSASTSVLALKEAFCTAHQLTCVT